MIRMNDVGHEIDQFAIMTIVALPKPSSLSDTLLDVKSNTVSSNYLQSESHSPYIDV